MAFRCNFSKFVVSFLLQHNYSQYVSCIIMTFRHFHPIYATHSSIWLRSSDEITLRDIRWLLLEAQNFLFGHFFFFRISIRILIWGSDLKHEHELWIFKIFGSLIRHQFLFIQRRWWFVKSAHKKTIKQNSISNEFINMHHRSCRTQEYQINN